jgi:chorismate mutase / prephenate dehydratase
MARKDPKKTRNGSKGSKTRKESSAGSAPRVSTDAMEAEIHRLDREIVRLVSRRAAVTIKHIQSQPNPTKALFSPIADDELTQLIEKGNPGPLAEPAMRGIFREMVSGARNLVKTVRIAYLGPAYSFTHLAAIERFGVSASFLPVNSIAAVFEEVNRGHADYGICPIENSTDGRVVDTLDMFTRLPLKICGEVQFCWPAVSAARSPKFTASRRPCLSAAIG